MRSIRRCYSPTTTARRDASAMTGTSAEIPPYCGVHPSCLRTNPMRCAINCTRTSTIPGEPYQSFRRTLPLNPGNLTSDSGASLPILGGGNGWDDRNGPMRISVSYRAASGSPQGEGEAMANESPHAQDQRHYSSADRAAGYRQIGRALRISQASRGLWATGLSYAQIKGIANRSCLPGVGQRTLATLRWALGLRTGIEEGRGDDRALGGVPSGVQLLAVLLPLSSRDGDEVTMHIASATVCGLCRQEIDGQRAAPRRQWSPGAGSEPTRILRQSQQKADLIAGSGGALDYIGGVPAAIVPDCLKSAVTKADPYEPDLNRAAAFARHYGMVVRPPAAASPRTKRSCA